MIDLNTLPADARLPLITLIVTEVARNRPFRNRWHLGAIILENERATTTSRVDLAAFLRANGLDAKAREATSRKVTPGSVLVWLNVDTPDVSVADFAIVNLATEIGAVEALHEGASVAGT